MANTHEALNRGELGCLRGRVLGSMGRLLHVQSRSMTISQQDGISQTNWQSDSYAPRYLEAASLAP